jgi:hypothetical protein
MWGGCTQNFVFTAEAEQMRAPRQVCVGLIQNAIVLPTTKPFLEQKHAIMDRVTSLINAAGEAGVNVLCLQVPIVLPFSHASLLSPPDCVHMKGTCLREDMYLLSPCISLHCFDQEGLHVIQLECNMNYFNRIVVGL